MEFIRKNIQKTTRNGKILSTNVSVKSSLGISGGSSGSGNYLPASSNGDGTYTVDLSKVLFTGNIIAEGEVIAYGSGESGGSTTGNVTIYDGLDSVATDVALSANQGRVLKNLIDTIDAGNITVDLTDYYKKTDVDTLLAGYAKSSHTHNYAGSSSVGGAATSANKVNSTLTFTGYQSKTFNGSAAVSVAIPSNTNQLTNGAGFITSSASISGNAASATKLATARTIWGQSFDGTANVSGAMTGVTTITASGAITCASLTASGEVTAHSDRRLKTDIRPLEIRGELNPVTYVKDGKESIGFIADEVKEVYPELVITDESTEEKYLSLNYQQLTAVLYAEIKELKNQIKELNEKVRTMAN